jgi:chemotaxis protein methyltransferase CheR
MSATPAVAHELPMEDEDFAFIVKRVKEKAGINLGPHKRNMVYARLSRRVRDLGLRSFAAYRERLEGEQGADEMGVLVNALTTNHTKFFRESHHFDHFAKDMLPRIIRKAVMKGRRKIRIWSAGCASGEEAYSIAMVLRHYLPDLDRWDALILATDIDTNALAEADVGIYSAKQVEDIPAEFRAKFVRATASPNAYRIAAHLRPLVVFEWLNLVDAGRCTGRSTPSSAATSSSTSTAAPRNRWCGVRQACWPRTARSISVIPKASSARIARCGWSVAAPIGRRNDHADEPAAAGGAGCRGGPAAGAGGDRRRFRARAATHPRHAWR